MENNLDIDRDFTDEEKLYLYTHYRFYAETCLVIQNKKAEIQPFIFNKPQEKVDEVFESELAKNKPLRFIVLKARQEGISTYFEGRIFHRTANDVNRKALVIGHIAKASSNLFRMTSRFHKNLPNKLKPTTQYSNRKELVFGDLESSFEIDTAENDENVGRSGTINDLHATEVAFWRDADAAMLALLQIVPEEPNTLVVIESTANGIGGWFYNTWQDAVNGQNDFIPIFLSWFDMPEYSRPFDNVEQRNAFAASLDDYEKNLLRKFTHITLEQLNWRRYYIKNKCNNDVDQFKQEYPSTPEEAFIASGRPVFNPVTTYEKYLAAEEPLRAGNLHYVKDQKTKQTIGVRWEDNPKGYIKLFVDYTKPEEIRDKKEEYRFALGIDVAEGLEQGDFSDMRCLDRKYMKVGLVWHGHIDPDELAEEQEKIQIFLKGKCFFNTEMNNHGLATIRRASKLGVYQYYREDFSKGFEYAERKDILGTKTTKTTKPDMINDLNEMIRDNHFTDLEKEFWSECLTFVKNEKGQMQAQNKDKDPGTKCFDDRVMAAILMIRCHLWMPNYSYKQDKVHPQWYYDEFGEDADESGTAALKHSSMGV